MKTLVIGKFGPEAFGLHIAETLAAMGHEAMRFDIGVRERHAGGRVRHRFDQARRALSSMADSVPTVRSWRIRRLWDLVGGAKLDLAIVCHDFLWPGEVAELKARSGAQVVLWFPDQMANAGKTYFLNAPYDALFFKDPYLVNLFSGVAPATSYYLPECFNPARHRFSHASADKALECDIVTAGALHAYRVAVFQKLSAYRVHIWGPPPPLWMDLGEVSRMYQGRPIADEEKAKVFKAAKIVLNTLHFAEIAGLNARAFEAAGIGAFQLVDWRPGLSQLFEDGRELVSFRGLDDLKKKIDLWLPRTEERASIAAAGQRRASADHTYERRLSLLLETVWGRARGFPMHG